MQRLGDGVRHERKPEVLIAAARVLSALCLILVGGGSVANAVSAPPPAPQLPWHGARIGADGRLAPWPAPAAAGGYDRALAGEWHFLESVPSEGGVPIYLRYAVFSPDLTGAYWQHDPASLDAAMVDSALAWHAYSGDRRALALAETMLDYELEHGMTPASWRWGGVGFPTSCAGDVRYGGCFEGLAPDARLGIDSDKVGELGAAFALMYEATGRTRYLSAAVKAGDALALNVRLGDSGHGPWPFRLNAQSGDAVGGAEVGGDLAGPLRLFDLLRQIGAGDTAAYARAAGIVWQWLRTTVLDPASDAYDRWTGFYEDVPFAIDNVTQMAPTMLARYLLTAPNRSRLDPTWKADVGHMLDWVRTTFGRGPFAGAVGIDEQRMSTSSCCSAVGLASDTARWAAVTAMLAATTGNPSLRRDAAASLALSTYFDEGDGRVSCCGDGFIYPYWFMDGYGDYIRNVLWAVGALPELLAPSGRNHLVASTSVIRTISYRQRVVSYTTFGTSGHETLRLRFRPHPLAAGLGATASVRRIGADFLVDVVRTRTRTVVLTGD